MWSEARFNMGIRSHATNDAFGWHNRSSWTVEDNYVDGVSLTTGEPGNREHLFTYAVGHAAAKCPGETEKTQPFADPQEFVGDAYVCDYFQGDTMFVDEWYIAQSPEASSEPIELRLMADQGPGNENVRLYHLVIYVR